MLKVRVCVNSSINVKVKSKRKYSLTCLGDIFQFTITISTFFDLWMSISDIVNFFSNTMRDLDDMIFMYLPPHYL